MSLPDDDLIIPPIFQNMKREPPGAKNDTSLDIFCEYGYQEQGLRRNFGVTFSSINFYLTYFTMIIFFKALIEKC